MFFFSSRRRHTRLQGDWSSDVCSSDLQLYRGREHVALADADAHGVAGVPLLAEAAQLPLLGGREAGKLALDVDAGLGEIGRASCRESVWSRVGAGIVV